MANRFAKIFASFLAALVGCSTSTTPQKEAEVPKGDSVQRQKFGDFEYAIPNGWTREKVGDGQLLMAPDIENNWQANLFLEYRDDPEGRSLEKALADVVPNLKDRKKQFREAGRKVEKHAGGFQVGTLEYTCVDQGTALTEWEIVIDAGNKKRFFVLASSATASWAKYQTVFQKFVESLKKSGA
jgi:hypothetical protein